MERHQAMRLTTRHQIASGWYRVRSSLEITLMILPAELTHNISSLLMLSVMVFPSTHYSPILTKLLAAVLSLKHRPWLWTRKARLGGSARPMLHQAVLLGRPTAPLVFPPALTIVRIGRWVFYLVSHYNPKSWFISGGGRVCEPPPLSQVA